MKFLDNWLKKGIIVPIWNWRFWGNKKVKREPPTWGIGFDEKGNIIGDDRGQGWIPVKPDPKNPPNTLPGPMA